MQVLSEALNYNSMEKRRVLSCITSSTVRALIDKANELKLTEKDILKLLVLRDQVYLIYFKDAKG